MTAITPDTTPRVTLTSDITVRLIDKCGGDHSVVAAAKVSTSGEDALRFASPDAETTAANAGFINYLMSHRHGTPFEHSSLTFFVHAPAFVWWEYVRHRVGHSFNLESARYKVLEPVFWVPRYDRKLKPSVTHKSARPDFVADPTLVAFACRQLRESYAAAYEQYQNMLYVGIANEVARAALPFAVYYSGWVTTNPRALMSFLSLRTHEPDATFVSYPQAEIEEAARVAETFLAAGWPITYSAFVKHGRVAP